MLCFKDFPPNVLKSKKQVFTPIFAKHWVGPFFSIICFPSSFVVVFVEPLSCIQLFVTPWLKHTRLPCPSLSPGVCSNSCPSSQRCYQTILSSAFPLSSCPQSFPVSGGFPRSHFFASDGQSIGASTLASVFSMNIQGWFPLRLTVQALFMFIYQTNNFWIQKQPAWRISYFAFNTSNFPLQKLLFL